MLSGHIKAQPVKRNKYSQKFENLSFQLVDNTWTKGSLFLFSLCTDTPLAVYIGRKNNVSGKVIIEFITSRIKPSLSSRPLFIVISSCGLVFIIPLAEGEKFNYDSAASSK
jgi:hypothetical protein